MPFDRTEIQLSLHTKLIQAFPMFVCYCKHQLTIIRELVDPLCRNGADIRQFWACHCSLCILPTLVVLLCITLVEQCYMCLKTLINPAFLSSESFNLLKLMGFCFFSWNGLVYNWYTTYFHFHIERQFLCTVPFTNRIFVEPFWMSSARILVLLCSQKPFPHYFAAE